MQAARPIKKVAVIGAGVMGAGIAAHVANAGVPVVLLDIVPNDAEPQRHRRGRDREMLKTEPAPFMSRAPRSSITPGNIEDDLGLLADCDWIVEAVIERLDVKQDALSQDSTPCASPASLVSSNTSTIPLAHARRRACPRASRAISHHPFLQSAALHAAAGNRDRPETRPERRGGRAFCRSRCSARASCAARTARASSPTGSAFFGCRRRDRSARRSA